MSVVSQQTTKTTRHEYTIPKPACWTDVKMAMHFAAEARKEAGLAIDYDDIIRVTSTDDEIVVYWEESVTA